MIRSNPAFSPAAPALAAAAAPDAAIARASHLLRTDVAAALALAQQLAKAFPHDFRAELIAGQALRLGGRADAAYPRMERLARARPDLAPAVCELGLSAVATGCWDVAVSALERATTALPAMATAWIGLAQARRALGREDDARRADLGAVAASAHDAELTGIAHALRKGELDQAEAALIARERRAGEEAVVLRMLGEIAWRRGDLPEAIDKLDRAIEIAPGFDTAREFLIRTLLQMNRLSEARDHAEALLASPFANAGNELLMATVMVRLGDQDGASAIYQRLLDFDPEQPRVWQNLGHVLKTAGKQDDAVAAYRQAVSQQPTLGEAWWSLANLKTVRFMQADLVAMRAALAEVVVADAGEPAPTEDVSSGARDDALHLHFALGKALEDAGDYAEAFAHYDHGNRLRRAAIRHDADAQDHEVAQAASTFTARFLAEMGPGGCPAPDPIFIVGLPRSGSTLVEQILSSHSRIEGTMELPDLLSIAARLHGRIDSGEFSDLAALMRSLTPERRLALGEEYIARTQVFRHSDKPLFIDKLPNNWQHVGLIRLILPHARVIDARRHPLSCCFSAWKQHFARGQTFSYDLADVGRYYRGYVGLMAAWDRAAPGAVHRVIYEDMIADTEREVRRLLDFLDLPFEPSCLEFWRNDRAVRTASSEQVRQPIFRDGLEQWRKFDAFLGPLRAVLGPVLDAYPDVPTFGDDLTESLADV